MSVRTDVVNLIVNVGNDQAKNQLNQLRKASADLNAELKGIKRNTEEYKAKAAELKTVNGQMDSLRRSIGLTSMTQKELVAELNKLKAQRGSLTPFTKEFDELSSKIKAVESRLYDVRNGVTGFSSVMHKVKDEVKQFGVMAMGYLGFQFVTDQFRNIVQGAGRLEDSLADIRKVTGLTSDEVRQLNNELKQIDTRSSNEQLRQLAYEAGKLGITGKENILGFVRAADQIQVALGQDLGEGATQVLGKIASVYKVIEDYGIEDGMLKIGSAINDIGQASAAQESYIVDFAKRMGGIAVPANITAAEIIALAGTMDSLGATAEVSTTAIGNTISMMVTDFKGFAAVAGITETALKQVYADQGGLGALKLVLEGVQKSGGNFEQLVAKLGDIGIEGSRAKGVLGLLANNLGELDRQLGISNAAFDKGTSITAEFAVKNETLGATLDKISKQMNHLVTSPFVMNFLTPVIEGFAKLIGATDGAKTALSEFQEVGATVRKLEKDIVPLIDKYDELKKKTTLNNAEQNELNSIMQRVVAVIPLAATEFDKYGNVIGINSEKAREFIRLQQLMLQEKNRDAIKESQSTVADLQSKLKQEENVLASVRKQVQEEFESAEFYRKMGHKELTTEATERLARWQNTLQQVQGRVADLNNRIIGQQQIQAELQGKNLEKSLDNIEKIKSTLDDGDPIITTDKKNVGKLLKQESEMQQHLKRFKQLLDDTKDEIEQMGMSDDEKTLRRINAKYRKMEEEAKQFGQKYIDIVRSLNKQELEIFSQKASTPVLGSVGYGQSKPTISMPASDRIAQNYINQQNGKAIDRKKQKEQNQQMMNDIIQSVQIMQGMMNDVGNLLANLDQKRLNRELESNKRRQDSYDELFKRKLISERQYDELTTKIRKENEAKQREFELRNARRQKAIGIAQAIVNGGIAITQIIAAYAANPIMQAILVGLTSAAIAAQVAVIASTPLPKAERGRRIKGKRHAQNGEIVEAEDGEVILSRNTVANNGPLVDELLRSSMYRSGAPIYPIFNPSISTQRVMYNGSNATSTNNSLDMNPTNDLLRSIANGLNGNNSNANGQPVRAYVVLSDMIKAKNMYDQLSRDSGLKQ